MSRPVPPWGIIGLAALDLRRRPDHRSELRSQLLMGEVVRRRKLSPGARWWEVENRSDGYVGWIRAWGVIPVSAEGARTWERRSRARVVVSFAQVQMAPGRGPLVSPLCWNGRVVPMGLERNHHLVELPDGRRGWVIRTALELSSRRPSRVEPKSLARRIQGLLGTPYLWGGRTPLGLDCSSFAQQVLSEQGLKIPRDAAQQFSHCRKFSASVALRLGDLIFFGPRGGPPAHVGIALGGGYFAHARGAVRVNSLDADNPLYDKGLANQFRGFGRPSARARKSLRA